MNENRNITHEELSELLSERSKNPARQIAILEAGLANANAEVARLRAEVDALKVERDFAIAAARTNDKAAKQMTADRDSQQRVCIRVMSELDALKEAARWVSVEERLPEVEEHVLTIYWTFGGGSAATIRALLDTGMWFDCSSGYLCPPNNVTHWRYITPPEADNA